MDYRDELRLLSQPLLQPFDSLPQPSAIAPTFRHKTRKRGRGRHPKAGGGTRDQKSEANSKPRTGATVSIASTLFAVSRRDDRSGKDGGSGGATIGGLSFWKIARPHGIRSAARAVKMIRTSQRFLEPAAQRRSRLIPKPWPGRFDHRGPQARAFPGTR